MEKQKQMGADTASMQKVQQQQQDPRRKGESTQAGGTSGNETQMQATQFSDWASI